MIRITLIIILIPLISILIYFTVKQIKIVVNQYRYTKVKDISHNKYDHLDLSFDNVETDYRIPRGQIPFFVFDISNMEVGQKERRYVGNAKSGIKIPFITISFQNKTFIESSTFQSWGYSKVTLTNRIIKFVSNSEKPIKREIKYLDIEQIKFVNSDKKVQIMTRNLSWPIRVTFLNNEDAVKFQNAVWTILYTYHDNLRKGNRIYDGKKEI